MSDPNTVIVSPECSEKLYPNKGKFSLKQLFKASMVKSAFSAGKRVEHMWVKVSEVLIEDQLVKGSLDNTPSEITHLTFGGIVLVPFKDIEDIWIEGQVPESVKRLLEIKEEQLTAEEFIRSLLEEAETTSGHTIGGIKADGLA
jgi:hypothetical protein